MSTEKINLNSLNSLNFQLGPSVNYQPEQQTPELYFSATAPVMFGKSFFNNFQTLLAPITPYTLEGAESERYGIMPDTNLAAIANTENWKPIKPSGNDYWEFRKANYLLSGGAGSGFLGRDVDLYALQRAKMGYWSGPYFQIKNPFIENMDQTEKDYNTYLQRLNQAKEEIKVNLGQDDDQVAYISEGIPRTKDGKIAWSSSGGVNIKYDGKEIPSHVVPQPMTMEQFKERTKAFTDAGSISRWMLSSQAEGGYLSGNALIGTLVDTAFDNPLYTNNLDKEYAKQTAIKLSLAKYNSGFNVLEMGVGTIADDIKSIIEKKEPNFDGGIWFEQLELPKEVRESLAKKNISAIDFIGSNNKNHALFILQDKLFKTTLQEKVDAYKNNNEFFNNWYGDVVGFGTDFLTMAANDPDLGVGAAATVLTLGAGAVVRGGMYGLKATGYLRKAAQLRKALKLTNKVVHTTTALATGELPTFLQNVSRLKQLGYIASTGAALNTVAALKDQNTRIALSMTGLQTDHQFEYSYSDLAVAAGIGAAFGSGLYGITQGLGLIKRKLRPETDNSGRTRMVTPEGTDATALGLTPLTRDAIEETASAVSSSTREATPEPITPISTIKTEGPLVTPSTESPLKVEPIKTIDIELESSTYKFREDEITKIEPTSSRNTVENIYVERDGNVYEISKLSIAEAKERANPKVETTPITGEKKTRLERVASDAEKFSDRATIREEGRTGTLGMAPESPTFNRREGESSIDYGRRSIRDGQINTTEDWMRITATKEEIASITADKENPAKQIRKIREIAIRSIDILKQLRESKVTDKDSTWFTDQEINLNRHIEDLRKLEYTTIGRRFKGFAKLNNTNKIKFLELAEKFKDVPKENFDKLINEEKGLSRSFRNTLKEYIYGRESLTDSLKIKDTDSPLVKKAKTIAQATFENRKNKARSLNKVETEKAQKAFLNLEFAKSISSEHRQLLEYIEKSINDYATDIPQEMTPIQVERLRQKREHLKREAVSLVAACIANLKLNPLKLTKFISEEKTDALGEATPAGKSQKFTYELIFKNLYDFNETPESTAKSITKVALHELGHIFSYVLNIEDQKKLLLAYSQYADLELLHTLEFLNKQSDPQYDTSLISINSTYAVNVGEFFANMFESLIYDRTTEAISKIEEDKNQLITVRLLLPFFRYVKEIATKVTENLNKTYNTLAQKQLEKLDNTISDLIKVADDIDYRSKLDAAHLGNTSWKLQHLIIPEDLYDGVSYKSYLNSKLNALTSFSTSGINSIINKTAINKFLTNLEKLGVVVNNPLMGWEIIANNPELNLKTIQTKILEACLNLTADDQHKIVSTLQSNYNYIYNAINPVIDDYLGIELDIIKDKNNSIALASCFMPNRIEEILTSLQNFNQSSKQINLPIILKKFSELCTISDSYKARSFANTLPAIFISKGVNKENIYMGGAIGEAQQNNINYKSIQNLLLFIKGRGFKLDEINLEKLVGILYGYKQGESIGGSYLNQFLFLEDVLNNVFEYTGITLDYTNDLVWDKFIIKSQNEIINNLGNRNITSEPKLVKALVANHDQQHNIKKPADLLVALSDITTEHSVIKHLLKTYYTEAEAKRFTLKDIESKFNDEKFAKAVWEASQNNPTIDGFAKALADLLVDKKKKEIKKTDKIKKILIDDKTINQKLKDTKVVDKEGKLLTVYHGTPTTTGFSTFKIEKENNNLFGSGVYFTEDPNLASAYAKKVGTVYPVYLHIVNPIDMDAAVVINNGADNIFIPALKKYDPTKSESKFVKDSFTTDSDAALNVDLYQDIVERAINYIINENRLNKLTNADIFNWIKTALEEELENGSELYSYMLHDILRSTNNDGITHIGGGRVKKDGVKHRVWIVFDSNQVYGKYTSLELKEKQVEVKKETIVPEPVKKEITVPEQYVSTELEGLKTVNELIEKLGIKSELRSKLVNYLKKNWSGIKTTSPDDIINNAIVKLLENSEELQKALDATPSNKGRTNIVFSYIVNTARGEATKQKRQQTKVSVGMVDNEGNNIDILDAKLAAESNKPIKKEQAETLLSLIPQLTLQDKNKDILLKYAVAKRDNPNLKDNEVAKLIGVTDKQLQNAKAALKKQVTMVEGELKLLRDEERPTTPKEAAQVTANNIVIKKSNDIIEGKTKLVSVEEARTKLEKSRKVRTQIKIASSTKVEELPTAMPEVTVKPTEEVLVVTGDTKDNSVKAGSVLVPENKVMIGIDKTEPTYVSTVKVNNEKRTLTLNLDKDNIIASVEATPEETFSDLGIEKNILLEVLKESEAPEQILIDILKEQNIDLIRLVKDNKTAAVIPTKDDVVIKEDTLDTSGRLPVIRKPEEKSPVVDTTIVDDKPVIDPTKLPIETDPKTGRSKATDPKIKIGISDSVVLNGIDKFDAQIMAGEELLRNAGTDPRFVKVLLLNFHRITSGLRENIGKTIETVPEQFLFFLDKVYEVYSTISNINKEKYGSRFEAINNIFWEYFDIEIAKELEAKGTPVEKLTNKTLEQILEFAKTKTDKAVDSYNKRYGTNLPEFTRPPSPLDFDFTVTDMTLGFPDKVKVKKSSYAAKAVASAKELITAEVVRRDLGLGVLIDPDLTIDNKPPSYKILHNFLKNLSQEHTEVFRSTNFIARWFRGSEKENRNKFRSALNWAANLTSSATGEGKTLRSYFNLMRWLSSFAENGKIMTHQIVKAGTHAFQTWEGSAHQVERSKSTLIKLNKELAIKTGNLQIMKKVEDQIVKSLVINNRPLTLADVETAVLSVKNDAKPIYIKDVFDSAVKLREEVIRRNKFILDLENSTEWITIVDEDGNPIKPENYFSLTFDANKVAQNNRSQIVDEMIRVRANTINNNKTLDRCIMLAMGWLWDTDGNPLTTRGKEGRDQLHIGETGFDADTLSRLEAKAGNRRYAPGTDLRKIPEIRKEADTKFFSYIDPLTEQVVICAIPETVDDLSPRDLARYKETVNGSTTHIAEQWKSSYGNTKSVIQTMMEELLMFKLREGGYSKYIQKPELGDNAFLQFFGKGGDHQGFAVSNLTWKELFDSNLLVEITRTNALEAYDNLISHRGFELLVQSELDRQLGHKGIRIYELFDVAKQMLMQMAGTNEDMAKDIRAGIVRLAEDYAEYAGRNPRIISPYAEGQENFARAAGSIIRATSGQRWGLRSVPESFVNLISGIPEVGVKETIDNVFNLFKVLLDRRDSSVMKRELFLTAHGVKSYLSDMEDRLMETGIISGVPSVEKGWFRRLIKYRKDSAGWVKPIEALGNLGVEIGSVKQVTALSRHIALVRFAQRNAKYILNGSALRLLALLENPTTKAELERLQQLSATSEKADKQLGNLQKKLAREAGFGGNWDHALTFMRFNLLDPEKLKALKYLLEKAGNNKNGVVNLNALQAVVDNYMSGPTGPIAKEVIERSFNDFMNALEVQITTDGIISESRGLNRDISISHRTGFGRLIKSLLQWSQSFQSNVLQNLQLKKPTVVLAEVIILYSTLTYLSDLIIDWLNGRSSADIKEELKDPSTYVYRMASTLPVFGSASAIYTSGLATISQLMGGTYKGFANPITPPAFGVLGSYGSRAFGSSYDLLTKGTNMTPEEIVAKFGDILPFNITFNGSPIAIPGRLLQEFEWLEEQNAFNKYLDLTHSGKNKYTGKNVITSGHSIVPKKSKQIADELEARRRKFLEDTNKMIKDRQKYKKSQ